jgi:uncharacterized membrane protein YeaQ/YmgE (transglycosylase-associated protein family)
MLGFIITIIISLAISLILYSIAQDKLFNGVWGAIPLGILGSWIGAYAPIFKNYGPVIDGAAIIPSIIGAVVLIAVFSLFKEAILDIGS